MVIFKSEVENEVKHVQALKMIVVGAELETWLDKISYLGPKQANEISWMSIGLENNLV